MNSLFRQLMLPAWKAYIPLRKLSASEQVSVQ